MEGRQASRASRRLELVRNPGRRRSHSSHPERHSHPGSARPVRRDRHHRPATARGSRDEGGVPEPEVETAPMMRRRLGCAVVLTGVALAQRGGPPDWNTSGNDAQRSHWVRTDPKISAESLRKPGFQFLWKLKLENEPRQLNALSPVILLDKYTGYRGHKSLGFLGGSSDNIFALDTDLGLIHWQNHLSPGTKQSPS